MNARECGVICKYIVGNWPSMAVTNEALEVYRLELGPLDFEEVLGTLRDEFASADFPPPPMKLRNAVIRRSSPTVTYEQAMSELLERVASVGRYNPEPEWSHPAIAAIVRQRGGWQEVCASTPARQAQDSTGLSMFNTWSAQFRDEFRVVAGRHERVSAHAALSAESLGELEEPGSRA